MSDQKNQRHYSIYERAFESDLCSDCPLRDLEITLKEIAQRFAALVSPDKTLTEVVEQAKRGPGRPPKSAA